MNLSEIKKGIQATWAVAFGFIPLGLAFGLLVTQYGFAWWWAPIFSTVIFAGSMEYLALGMVTAGMAWPTALLTGFLVNFRHIFYGLTYPRHLIKSRLGRAYATYALIDEAYAVTAPYGPKGKGLTGTSLLTISIFLQTLWVGSGLVGALGGSAIQIHLKGLDFALTALFVVLAVESFESNRDYSLPLLAIAAAVLAVVINASQMLLIALVLYFVILLARFWSPNLDKKMEVRR